MKKTRRYEIAAILQNRICFRGVSSASCGPRTSSNRAAAATYIHMAMSRVLLLLVAQPALGWVLFSPVRRTKVEKVYEDAEGTSWTGPSSFNLDLVSLRWGLPQSAYSDEALASGISFALHRDFCSRLMPLFPEAATSGYITCTELHDTVKRAMDTWAIIHKKIYFRDVTDQCSNITSLSQKCPAAELFIVPDALKPSSLTVARDLAAYVTHNTQNIDYNPYTTSGYRLNTGLGVRDCTMTLRAPLSSSDFCWYLDTTFCYGFHRKNEPPMSRRRRRRRAAAAAVLPSASATLPHRRPASHARCRPHIPSARRVEGEWVRRHPHPSHCRLGAVRALAAHDDLRVPLDV